LALSLSPATIGCNGDDGGGDDDNDDGGEAGTIRVEATGRHHQHRFLRHLSVGQFTRGGHGGCGETGDGCQTLRGGLRRYCRILERYLYGHPGARGLLNRYLSGNPVTINMINHKAPAMQVPFLCLVG